MPQKQKTTVTVTDDGTLLGETAGETLIQWLADTFALFAGGCAEIVVQRPTRTLRQNRTLWGVVYPQVHEGLKTDMNVGDVTSRIRSTRTNTVRVFTCTILFPFMLLLTKRTW